MNVVIFCDADRDAGETAATVSALAQHAPPDVFVQPCIGTWTDGPRLLRDALAAHPAVIHLQGFGSAGTWGLLAARYAGIPAVAAWDSRPGATIADVWRHRLLRRCARVLVPSTDVRDELLAQGYREQTLRLWRPGVDLDRVHPERRRAFALTARRAAQRYAWSISVRRLSRSWREAATQVANPRWDPAVNVTQCLPPTPPQS